MRSDSKPDSVFFIGVTGGSGAGKTVFAKRLREAFGVNFSQIISQDAYYYDQRQKFDSEGGSINFDVPESIEFDLLQNHLHQLQLGFPIQIPVYNFSTHQRMPVKTTITPTDIIIVEGGLILTQPSIREMLTESVFLDTPEEIRLQRLIRRDVLERGRSIEGILTRFRNHAKPMHEKYIEPARSLASYCVYDERSYYGVIEELVENLGVDS